MTEFISKSWNIEDDDALFVVLNKPSLVVEEFLSCDSSWMFCRIELSTSFSSWWLEVTATIDMIINTIKWALKLPKLNINEEKLILFEDDTLNISLKMD